MKKIIYIALLSLFIFPLFASEIDDFKFSLGLYSDANYNLARIELQKFIEKYPDSRFIHDAEFLLANIYLKEEKYTSAKDIYSKLYTENTNPEIRAEIILNMAQCHFFTRDFNQAEILFSKFNKEFPKHELKWNSLYYLGRIAFENKDFSKASKYYKETKKKSSDIIINVAELELLLAQDKKDKAKKLIQNILKNNKGNEQANQALLIYHNYNLKNHNYNEIFTVGFNFVDPSSQYYDDYNLMLAIAYYETEDYKKALELLVNLKSDRAEYYKALCFLETDQIDKARTIFQNLQESRNSEINTNSFFYLARINENVNESLSDLQEFIKDNPEHIFVGDAYYQMGFNFFKLGDYEQSIANLKTSLTYDLDDDTISKAKYLIAECNFQLNNTEIAFSDFSEYVTQYPDGEYTDEALFKIGLYYFYQDNYPDAFVKFDRVLSNFPESDKKGMCYFYIGEMFFFQSKYFNAERYYELAEEGNTDKGYISLRFCQIYYYLKKYEKALAGLNQVPEDEKYLYEKYLLKGNINFALKRFDKTLEAFNKALDYSLDEKAKEIVLIRKAWTLYQMKRFNEASEIYLNLSIQEDSTGKYIIKAGSAAFSAENYTKAIEIFQEYLEKYQDKDEKITAKLSIANSYYNLGDFINSSLYYNQLITPEIDAAVLHNALNGLEWSIEQTEKINFLDELNELIQKYEQTDFKVTLLKRKATYQYNKALWENVLLTIKKIEELSPDSSDIREMILLKALALIKSLDYEQADKTFAELISQRQDPDILFHWAQLKILQNNKSEAIQKLRKASMLSRDKKIWLNLLELEKEINHDKFLNDFHKFMEFATNGDKQNAEILWLEWKIQNNDFENIQGKIDELLTSKRKLIKANAQFLKGFSLYQQKDYETAIPELLRVRYLFPEISDVRFKAESYACLAYIESGKKEEAEQLYEIIKNDIPQDMKSIINNKLSVESK